MSREEARAHVRAAQEAEIAGNKAAAVGHLERAALEYVRIGANGKAAAMYQYCLKLQPNRTDLKDALAKAETWAANEGAGGRDAPPPPLVAALESRGPVLSPAEVDAWCSFCCQPGRDVGPLVQGPAGAYICRACLDASESLLGVVHKTNGATAPTPRPSRDTAALRWASAPSTWLGSADLLHLARAALEGKGPPVVVVGPEGSGKTALLDALATSGGARRVDLRRGEAVAEGQGAVLVDGLESAAEGEALRGLEGRPFVAALRAEARSRSMVLRLGTRDLSLPTCEAELPAGLPFAVSLALESPSRELLGQLLARELQACPAASLAPRLKDALVARALKSGRGAKGLLGELRLVLAAGEGPFDLGTPEKKPPRKKS